MRPFFISRSRSRLRFIRWVIIVLLLGLFTPRLLNAQSGLNLSLIGTSEPDSSDMEDGSAGNERPVLVGEVVTFRLHFEIGEGTNNDVNVVVDLPPGLQYMANSESLSFVNDTDWSDTAAVSGGDSSGADVLFDFGTVTNTDSDADPEAIVIEFNVLVLNVSGNQNGVLLATNATLNANGALAGTSEDRIVVVVEPDLTMTKTINLSYEGAGLITTGAHDEADAGDQFTYHVRIENTGSAPAYNVELVDPIPIDYVEQFGSLTDIGPDGTGSVYNSSTGEWTFTVSEIDPGASVTADLRVEVRSEVAPGESWDNTANITYTSLMDADGTDNNVPGGFGDDDGARDGSDGIGGAVDDYAQAATSPAITVPELDVAKAIEYPTNTPVVDDPSILYGGSPATDYADSTDDAQTGASEDDVNQLDLAIGETFSYILTVTFPEGTSYDFTTIDLLSPDGHTAGARYRVIEMLSAEVIHVGANLSGGGLEPVGTVFTILDVNADGDGTRAELFLNATRDVLNAADNVQDDNDRYVIRITARLDDEDESGGTADVLAAVFNSAGYTAGNRVQYQWRDQGGNQTTRNIVTYNDIVEPDVEVTKTTDTTAPVDAGDTVRFTLTLANNGTAPAYNVVVQDTYPQDGALDEVIEFASVDAPASTCDDIAGWTVINSSLDVTEFRFDELSAGSSCTIVLHTTVQPEAAPGETYTNSAALTSYDSTPQGVGEPDNRNYTGNTDTSTFTVESIVPTKAILTTSEAHTDDTQDGSAGNERPVAIGEVITYQLTTAIPEGAFSLVLTDTLPSGLTHVDGTVTLYTNSAISLTFADVADPVPDSAPGLALPADTTGAPADPGTYHYDSGTGDLEVNLGSLTNNDNDGDTEEVVILFEAVVANSLNNAGDVLSNTASAAVNGGSVVHANTVGVVVYESLMSISKGISATLSDPTGTGPFDGGDTVVYDITVMNVDGTYASNAYDIELLDGLDDNLELNAVVVSGPGYLTVDDSGTRMGPGGDVDLVLSELRPGDTVGIRVATTVLETVTEAQVIANQADLTWTSLPGTQGTNGATPGGSGDADGERNGSGGVNDYDDSAGDSFTVSSPYDAEKAITATSESHTDDSSMPNTGASDVPAAVGEVVRYRLTTRLAEGTMVNLRLTDQLPVDGGVPVIKPLFNETFQVSTINVQAGMFSSVSYPGLDAADSGTVALFDAGGTAQFSGLVSYNAAANFLQLDFGDVVNHDGDPDIEYLVVAFDAYVPNVAAVNAGDVYANGYEVYSDDFGGGAVLRDTSNRVTVAVEEPLMSVSKGINATLSNPAGTGPFDAGDNVVYDIVVSNPSGATATTAFDLTITDALNSHLDLTNPIAFVGVPASTTVTDNSDYAAPGQSINVEMDQLGPGESVTMRVTTTVLETVTEAQVIANQADLTWTSLPGTQGTNGATPGGSGDADGERNGSGSVNDYNDSASDSFTVSSPYDAEKAITATSESHTDDSSLPNTGASDVPAAVGEVVRYRLTTRLAEGTMVNLRLTDQLPVDGGVPVIKPLFDETFQVSTINVQAGMFSSVWYPGLDAADSGTVALFDAGGTAQFSGLVSYNAAANFLQFDFGDVVNRDGDADTEYLVVEFNAYVADNPAVNAGDVYGNDYEVYSDDFGGGAVLRDTSNSVNVEVARTELALTKALSGTDLVNVGDTVAFDIAVAHTADSTADAFHLIITDTLPTPGTSLDGVTGGTCSGVTTVTGTGVLTFTMPGLTLADGACTVGYSLIVGSDVTADSVYTNTALVTYETLAGGVTQTLSTDPSSVAFTTQTADVVVAKGVTPGSVEPGEIVTYALDFSHNGFTATNVILTDTLPAEITVLDVTSSGDVPVTRTGSSPTHEFFEIAELSSGQGGTITITARVDDNLSAGTTFINIVEIGAAEPDGAPNNNVDSAHVTVQNVAPRADAGTPQIVSPGDMVTLDGSASSDANDDSLSCDWTQTGGLPVTLSGSAESPTFTAPITAGTVLTFGLTVTDTGGLSDSDTVNVTVTDPLVPVGGYTKPLSWLELLSPTRTELIKGLLVRVATLLLGLIAGGRQATGYPVAYSALCADDPPTASHSSLEMAKDRPTNAIGSPSGDSWHEPVC